ncbi:MAG TPA: hypothetical protein VMU17_04825, partial [Elusimicrobiota bacterium]|nr:hypothetical protein [Elusimicrobiota bacterium]
NHPAPDSLCRLIPEWPAQALQIPSYCARLAGGRPLAALSRRVVQGYRAVVQSESARQPALAMWSWGLGVQNFIRRRFGLHSVNFLAQRDLNSKDRLAGRLTIVVMAIVATVIPLYFVVTAVGSRLMHHHPIARNWDHMGLLAMMSGIDFRRWIGPVAQARRKFGRAVRPSVIWNRLMWIPWSRHGSTDFPAELWPSPEHRRRMHFIGLRDGFSPWRDAFPRVHGRSSSGRIPAVANARLSWIDVVFDSDRPAIGHRVATIGSPDWWIKIPTGQSTWVIDLLDPADNETYVTHSGTGLMFSLWNYPVTREQQVHFLAACLSQEYALAKAVGSGDDAMRQVRVLIQHMPSDLRQPVRAALTRQPWNWTAHDLVPEPEKDAVVLYRMFVQEWLRPKRANRAVEYLCERLALYGNEDRAQVLARMREFAAKDDFLPIVAILSDNRDKGQNYEARAAHRVALWLLQSRLPLYLESAGIDVAEDPGHPTQLQLLQSLSDELMSPRAAAIRTDRIAENLHRESASRPARQPPRTAGRPLLDRRLARQLYRFAATPGPAVFDWARRHHVPNVVTIAAIALVETLVFGYLAIAWLTPSVISLFEEQDAVAWVLITIVRIGVGVGAMRWFHRGPLLVLHDHRVIVMPSGAPQETELRRDLDTIVYALAIVYGVASSGMSALHMAHSVLGPLAARFLLHLAFDMAPGVLAISSGFRPSQTHPSPAGLSRPAQRSA